MPEHSEHSKERDQALMTDIQAFHAVSDSHYMPCKYRTQTLHRCGGQNDLLLQSSGHERKENLFSTGVNLVSMTLKRKTLLDNCFIT